MAVPMASSPDNSTVDDLLNQPSERFLLDEPIAGNRLGDFLAETIRDAGSRPLPDVGQTGNRRTVRRDVEEPLTFGYPPHQFPGMDEGDTLLLFSDGLVEPCNDFGEQSGTYRAADVLRRGGPEPEIADNNLRAIENFHDLERLDDDLSLVVLQRRIGIGSSL
jgi:hypothetical protein